ncbi:divalent metal cation transporter MntH [Arthrobacter sp. StoSoilB3]|jgi:manganese transport protein|uniref:Nramp family divalent metal transporter n=1 Tax=Paenarthrobacter TaxID=1742992 RepID=UPI000701CCFB|nr:MULTISPECIES: Nramp family divalent metal transporter [Paenarthrobacter]KQR05928.1 manganese transporter [Arthrobacter sp. Leaf145]BCW11910.1 divalent metal cation transporter MntH [Arthrobacter sp. NtRootA2]BCW15994.1 divalent metal cation transporter MntH [Arthrobacter sp. NtRootA4]BCW24327.1 divalent metal cation transporter MntH [Arthrobacter sp. NtRootC7]BCW28594.1 divalent metal cation transporter MntH [Arthrobacter sp. NtRootC45]BCW32866.1 divalent metal cation transporter MntH [Art
MAAPTLETRATPGKVWSRLLLLGPAFVAAIAYVDPGNVAANLTAGANYGYLLVWVLVVANAMAVLVQYQSAKLGLATGMSLPEILGKRLGNKRRRLYWLQAEVVAGATDMAEVIGGAVALNLLFGIPLLAGGVIVGIASMLLLALQSRRGQRSFEYAILVLLGIIAVGFVSGLFVNPPDAGSALGGLVPRFEGTDTILLAASMLGATVMPHAIYLHSALARDRHGFSPDPVIRTKLIRATRTDVVGALLLAGVVNISMLLLAASSLRGIEGTDTIAGAHAAVTSALGPAIGVIFAIGLLASGLASTSVGCYAGATIMGGLLKVRIPLLTRRVITLIPALIVLGAGIEPTLALVLSQVLLSFGIPFALIPLIRLTGKKDVMGLHTDGMPLKIAGWTSAVLIVGLNCVLITLTLTGQS